MAPGLLQSLLPKEIIESAESLASTCPKTPTQDEYFASIRHECRRRGLIGWEEEEELTDTDISAAFSFESYVAQNRLHHTWLTKEQWVDPTDSINDFEFRRIDSAQQMLEQSDEDDEETNQVGQQASQEDERDAQRKTFLETHAPLHLQTITDNTKRDFLAAGGTEQRLDEIENHHPTNTILYWIAELWHLKEQLKTDKDPREELFLSIRVFCDIPQEDCHVVHCKIPYNETWLGFSSKMNQQLLVRYLIKKHNPDIAETLFVDDDTIWPPEGILPLRNEDDSIVAPNQYTKRADIVYEGGSGRGWWSLVHPKKDANGLTNLYTDWKAVDNAEDWDCLMRWLNEHREATVAFRHQSTKERMEFVTRKRKEEETVLGFPGYVPFNLYLDRHWDMIEDKKQLYGPLRQDSYIGEELEMEVPEGSERLQSTAAREIDEHLRSWEIKKGESDKEVNLKGVAKGSDVGPSANLEESLIETKAKVRGQQPQDGN